MTDHDTTVNFDTDINHVNVSDKPKISPSKDSNHCLVSSSSRSNSSKSLHSVNSSSYNSTNNSKKILPDLNSDEDNTKVRNLFQLDRDIVENNDSGVSSSKMSTSVTAITSMFGGFVLPMSEESLLRKLSSTNPFYRFHKQSHSFKVVNSSREPSIGFPSNFVRKSKSDSNIPKDVNDEDFLLEINGKQEDRCNKLENDSMVITSPLSSSLIEDRKNKIPSETQTILLRPIKKQRLERSFRRFFDTATLQPKSLRIPPSALGNDHYICISPSRLKDFPEHSGEEQLKKRSVLKQLSLRKPHKQNDCLNANLPQLKKLKISYPDRTHSIQSIRADVRPSTSSYFERLQLKTKIGLRRIKEKCRTFKHNSSHDCNRDARDDSFKFISDRTKINHYETKCAQQAIYKSYKSELDLTKNLQYLDAYLQQNYDKNLSGYKKSSHSVGRVAGSKLLQHKDEVHLKIHKRSISCGKVIAVPQGCIYNTVETLPITTKTVEEHSDSLSSSDYASVFSEPSDSATPEILVPPVGYEHPDISEFFIDNLAVYSSDQDQFFLESEAFYLDHEHEEEVEERTLQVIMDDFEFPTSLKVDTNSWYQQQNDDRNFLIYDTSYREGGKGFHGNLRLEKYENYLEHYQRHKKKTNVELAPEDYRSARTRRNLGGIEYSMSKLKASDIIDITTENKKSHLFTSSNDYGDVSCDSMQLLSKSHPTMPCASTSSTSVSSLVISSSLQPKNTIHPQHRYNRQKRHHIHPNSLSQRTTSSKTGSNAYVNTQYSSTTASRVKKVVPPYISSLNHHNETEAHLPNDNVHGNESSIQIVGGFGPSTMLTTPQGMPTKSFSSTSASSSTTSSSGGGGGCNAESLAKIKLPLSLATISGDQVATLTQNPTTNSYILENIRKFYQQQQPLPSSLNSSTTNSSSSSSTTSSLVSQQHQQKILTLQYHQQQLFQSKQQLAAANSGEARNRLGGQTPMTSNFRCSSTASNMSSDNFDSFICGRNGGVSAASGKSGCGASSDIRSVKRSLYQTSSIQRNGYHDGSDLNKSNEVITRNIIIANDYMNADGNVHREKYITSIGRPYTSNRNKLSPNFKAPRENYILEYEC